MRGNCGDLLSKGLFKLRELTDSLPRFPEPMEPVDIESSNGYREYKMTEGSCFSWFIHRSGNDIAIHRWFCSKGTIFPEHTHQEKEWIIIYSGTMVIQKGGEEIILHKGDSIVNDPLIPHSSTYPEDCKFITIMIPPSEEFPHG